MIKIRTKIEIMLVSLLLILVSIVSVIPDDMTITDYIIKFDDSPLTQIRFNTTTGYVDFYGNYSLNETYDLYNTKFSGPADFVVSIYSEVYYARNSRNGTLRSNTDCAVLVNELMDELYNGTVNHGGKILFQTGVYNIPDPLIMKPGICLEGTTGIKSTDEPGTSFHSTITGDERYTIAFYANKYGHEDSIKIKNIKFGCYSGHTDAYIYMHRSHFSVIEDCSIGFGTFNYSVYLNGTHATWIEKCHIRSAQLDGVYMESTWIPSFYPNNDCIIRDSWIRGHGRDGIFIDDGATAVLVVGCAIVGNRRYDINCGDDGGDVGPQRCTFRDNYLGESSDTNDDYPSIHLFESRNMLIDGNYFNENSTFINASYTNFPNYLRDNTISNCWFNGESYGNQKPLNINGSRTTIRNCNTPGIRIDWGNDVTIQNCNASDTNVGIILDSICENALIENCVVVTVNTSGIEATGVGSIIRGNRVYDVANGAGIYGIRGTIVEDNNVTGSGTTYAIRLDDGEGSRMSDNIISGSKACRVYAASAIVSNNYFNNMGTVDVPAITLADANIIVEANIFENCFLFVGNEDGCQIINNQFLNVDKPWGISVEGSTNLSIIGNYIEGDATGADDYGIQITSPTATARDIFISENTIVSWSDTNEIGIYIKRSAGVVNNVTIKNNNIKYCNYPLNITDDCYNISIFDNNFLRNTHYPIISTISNRTFGNDGWENASNWLVIPTHEPSSPIDANIWLNLTTGDIAAWGGGRWNWIEN